MSTSLLPLPAYAVAEYLFVSYALSSVRVGYSLVLNPLYGSTAARQHLEYVLAAGCAIAAFVNVAPVRYLQSLLACLLFVSPITTYWTGVYTARWNDYHKGPLLVHLVVIYPIVVAAVSSARLWRGIVAQNTYIARIAYGAAVLAGILVFDRLALLTPGGVVTSSSIFFSLGTLCIFLSWFSPAPVINSKRKKTSIVSKTLTSKSWAPYIIPSIVCFLASLAYPNRPLQLPYTDPSGVMRVLASETSVTGRIVVQENHEIGFRFLRADHSLLGGQWIDVPGSKGQKGDSIYTAFLLQEGARFVQRPSQAQTKKKHEHALIIGLGVGISAGSFMKHGIDTTVVEIDPVVYKYAKQYFGLKTPDAVYLTDARGWVHKQASTSNAPKYDIVVHDCFSGGSVPAHIFTLEFWNDLKKIVAPEGVVAVNYAGYLGSNPARGILATLLASFKQCRVFHDRLATDTDDADFLNMVFFCSNAQEKMTFRRAAKADYLNSIMRQRLFDAWPTLEVSHARIRGVNQTDVAVNDDEWVLTDKHNPLSKWQHDSALHHWQLMREILSNVYWESF